ncbi:MAG: hypothetical protein ACI8QZ_003350 [Chlamydiales bacterium]|jgi:hypothetical protein
MRVPIAALSGSLLVLTASIATANQGVRAIGTQRLTQDPPVAEVYYSNDISMDGDQMVVTAGGVVEIYQRIGSEWVFDVTLTGPVRGAGRFGDDLALEGNTLAVTGQAASQAATVWIYEKGPGGWVEVLEYDLPGSDALFGASSVAVSAGRVAFGCPLDTAFQDRGGAAVLRKTGAIWGLECEVHPIDGAAFDQFGIDVDIEGSMLIVGANGDHTTGFPADGSVYVYDLSVSCTSFVKILDTAPTHRGLGEVLSLDGGRIAVGYRRDDTNGTDRGGAAVYDLVGGTWVETTLVPAVSGAPRFFGWDSELCGDTLLIGSWNDGAPNTAHLFRWDGSQWCQETQVFPATGGMSSGGFGRTVALGEASFAVGATYAGPPSNGGALYTFDFGPDQGTAYCAGGLNSTGNTASIGAFGSSIVADNGFSLHAFDAPANHFGLFFFGPNQIQVPLNNGFRCVGGATQRLYPIAQINPGGYVMRSLDFTSGPALSGIANVVPVTMNFQLWYRDAGSSNLTDGVEVSFQ